MTKKNVFTSTLPVLMPSDAHWVETAVFRVVHVWSHSAIFPVLQYQITRAAGFPPICIFLNGDFKPVVKRTRWLFSLRASQHFLFDFFCDFDVFLPCAVRWGLTYLYRWNKSPGKAAASGSLGQLGNNYDFYSFKPTAANTNCKNTFQRSPFPLSLYLLCEMQTTKQLFFHTSSAFFFKKCQWILLLCWQKKGIGFTVCTL